MAADLMGIDRLSKLGMRLKFEVEEELRLLLT